MAWIDEYHEGWDRKSKCAGTSRGIPEDLGTPGFGVPRGFDSLLALAHEHDWRVGCISLVARFNHPRDGIPPFFMEWEYLSDGKWQFQSAKARNGQRLNSIDCKSVIKQPEYLLKEDPNG